MTIFYSISGHCQSPSPSRTNSRASNQEESGLLYGRAICERYNENFTSPEVVLCSEGIKQCFTKATVSNTGYVHIIAKGCWSFPKSEEGGCTMRGCLFGTRKGLEEKTERTCCCRGFTCNKNSTYVQRILVFEEPSTTLPTVVSIGRGNTCFLFLKF